MRQIKKLERQDKHSFKHLSGVAYPGFNNELIGRVFDLRLNSQDTRLYGLFEDERALGIFRYHDFQMNFHGEMIPVSGLGGVAVDMVDKKEKVCLEMIKEFHEISLSQGAVFATLYPFRLNFYRKMGYGYGPRMQQYGLKIKDFPTGDKSDCFWLEPKHDDEWLDFYNRYANAHHGMMEKKYPDLKAQDELGIPRKKRIGVRREGRLTASATLKFVNIPKDNLFSYDLEISEIFYEESSDLKSLCAFIRAQEDQIENAIVIDFDEDLIYSLDNLNNPFDTSEIFGGAHVGQKVGYGLMYRVLDLERFVNILGKRDFNGANLSLVFNISDTMLEKNNRRFDLNLENGRISNTKSAQNSIEIKLDIADFSSLMMGSISLESLYRHQRADISEPKKTPATDAALKPVEKPRCWTMF